MVRKIAPEKPASTKVRHGKPSPRPRYPLGSPEDLEKLGDAYRARIDYFADAEKNFKRLTRCVSNADATLVMRAT